MFLVTASSGTVTSEEGGEEPPGGQPVQATTAGPRTVRLPIASLILEGSPRQDGVSPAHVAVLANLVDSLPPILVHQETMHVLDGAHRVEAAKLRGHTEIAATLFEGDSEAAFVAAVQANIAHGLPLSLADRRAAAGRILLTQPHWSDRAIAAVTGLSASTVRLIRERQRAQYGSVAAGRVGRDGRRRPVDATAGRRRAAKLLTDQPDAPLRAIARIAGVSVGTVRDVRERLGRGESPVPRSRRKEAAATKLSRQEVTAPLIAGSDTPAAGPPRPPSAILESLRSDPSLRYSETGRSAIRWLSARFVSSSEWSRLAEGLPAHCTYSVAEFATACAQAWQQIAAELIRRTDNEQSGARQVT